MPMKMRAITDRTGIKSSVIHAGTGLSLPTIHPRVAIGTMTATAMAYWTRFGYESSLIRTRLTLIAPIPKSSIHNFFRIDNGIDRFRIEDVVSHVGVGDRVSKEFNGVE
jgi:hypothetical protein